MTSLEGRVATFNAASHMNDNYGRYMTLGIGAYSHVFLHRASDLAIKVTEKSDQAGIDYYSFIMNNDFDNPYYPRIYKTFETSNSIIYYIERLRDFSYYSETSDTISPFIDNCSDYLFSAGQKDYLDDPKLRDALDSIWLIKQEGNHAWDFHPRNIMFRDEKTPVITDPLS